MSVYMKGDESPGFLEEDVLCVWSSHHDL